LALYSFAGHICLWAWQETRTDFQLDQRPVLDLVDIPIPGHVDGPNYGNIIPGHVAWNYSIKNYGKGPAFDVRICPPMRVGGSRLISSNNGNYGERFEIVSSKLVWQTAVFPDEMTINEAKVIEKEEFGVVLKLTILYKDTFKTTYKKIICQFRLPNGAIAFNPCTGYPFTYLMEDKNNCESTY
jgi:hypothetical protein